MRGTVRLGTAALVAALSLAGTELASADVSLSINIGPPPVVVAQPPAMVLVPGTTVYFVPDYDFDVFYYSGYWWSPRGDRWYRARGYNGPWRVVSRRYVPVPVYRVPRDYRRMYHEERHIPYGQWKKEHGRPGRGGGGEWREHGGRGHGEGRGEGRGHGDRGDHGDRGERGGHGR